MKVSGTSLKARCDGTLIIFPEDFGQSEQPILRFLCTEYMQGVRCIDLRRLPADVTSASLLWSVLKRSISLQRVFVGHQARVPHDATRSFFVEISLSEAEGGL